MVFSSPLFLFLFLPLILLAYFASPKAIRNGVLFIASVLFYTWGEKAYVAVLLASLLANYFFARRTEMAGRPWLIAAIVFNLGLLVAFKYVAFLAGTFLRLKVPQGHLPIGISFFTFQAMSYVIDVYRRDVRAERSLLRFGLFVFLFPHLIAGPIVRYRDLAHQLRIRRESVELFADGIRRFVVGLAKKMLLANPLAATADAVFLLSPDELSAGAAWLGLACYTLQIYFDFSGYTDMAIGLGRMFGFTFLENFRYPYAATSLTDFWRRWHISLSTWFRDYLYIPLGGNRSGPMRTAFNLFAVFLLCGFWHGANWTFLAWGAWHGGFLILERAGLAKVLQRFSVGQHVYTLLVVMLGWVMFRCVSLQDGWGYWRALFGNGAGRYEMADFWNRELPITLLVAAVASLPVVPWLREQWSRGLAWQGAWSLAGTAAVGLLLVAASVRLAAETYQPFIYFRF